jgi:O-antigen ligase
LLIATATFVFMLAKRRLLNIRFVFAMGAVLVTIGALIVAFWDLILLRFETGSDPKYRIRMIEIAIPMMLENPILGVGLYNYEFHSMAEFNYWHPVHNDYLRLGAETGVPGLILFLLILILPLRQAIKMLDCRDKMLFATALGAMCGMIAMMVAINFGPEYQNYRVKVLYWLLVAMVFVIPRVVAQMETVRKAQFERAQQNGRMSSTGQSISAGLSQKRR